MSVCEPNPVLDGLMPITDFAASVKRTPRTIRRWGAMGLPIIKRGNLVLVNVEKARAWLAAGERGGLAPPRRRMRP